MVTWLPGSDDSKRLVHDMVKFWIYMGLVREVMGRPLKFTAQCISQIEAICLCYDNMSWQNTAGKPCFVGRRVMCWPCYIEYELELEKKIIGLVTGKFAGTPMILMVKTMVSCRFPLNPIQWKKAKCQVLRVAPPACRPWDDDSSFIGMSGSSETGLMMLGGSKKGIDSCLCVVFFNGKWNDMIYIYKSIYVIIYLIIYIWL